MDITVLNSSDSACNEFIKKMPGGKLEHLPAWSFMVEQTFGHKSFYLVAREGQRVRGVLPLIQVRSKLFGNRMVSQAFSNYGGPLAGNSLAVKALYERAVELATENGCESIEFRNVDPMPFDLHVRTDKITMYLPLAPDPDALWKSLKSEIRNRVRKAEKAGISVSDGGPELIDAFYSVWTIRMRQLGTPCYPKRLFQGITDAFAGNTRIFLVYLGQLVIGGAFVSCYNGLVQMRWVATLTEHNYLSPNVFLYWTVINRYCLADASCFDFGRSTVGSTQHEFKRRWGAQAIQLNNQYWSAPGKELSLATPDNPKYSKKVEVWKKLPLWFTRLAGPYISRSLP